MGGGVHAKITFNCTGGSNWRGRENTGEDLEATRIWLSKRRINIDIGLCNNVTHINRRGQGATRLTISV